MGGGRRLEGETGENGEIRRETQRERMGKERNMKEEKRREEEVEKERKV